ncbi:MAG: cytochrome P450 [Solirubrobacterales bacterium]|nr:cytochrome P450 [Solirubrobacterales bacterium]
MSLPPGPSAPPAVQTIRWLLGPIAFMDGCRRRYGDAFSVKFLGFQTPMVMISDPESIRSLYRSRENGLPPGRTVALEPVMGPRSVLLLEGTDHLSRRKLMLPAFHGERMRRYESVIAAAASSEIDSWPLHSPFPIHPRMQAVTLEVILRAVFGVTDPGRLERLRAMLALMLANMASPRLQLRVLLARRVGRTDPIENLRRQTRAVDDLLHAEIAERRADPRLDERDDILSMLVAARFEDGEPMDDGELRDQLITLLLAGHETTATALAWTLDLLLRNPGPMARLRAEIGDGDGDEYLRAVIAEGLRLRPVVPIAGRRLGSELRVGPYLLEPGTDVTPAIWLTHTRADVYPEPLDFRPERFLGEAPETYAWIPFGGGVRRCLGAAFAEFEMRVVLREVLGRCELRGARSAPERIARRNITFSPRGGTPVIVTARRAAREHAATAA